MKVLFAVSSESISDAIVKRYQKEYKEILSYKNVYYFNAILKEIQKDKTYDRIIISEDLESFSNNNYEAIDKFIFDKLDNISDEAEDINGNETTIILICSDRHTKGSSFLVKLFGIGIYNALLGNERSMDQVCKLINKPRVKKEAKAYYNIDAEDVSYSHSSENEVSESEINSILNHFKKLGRNSDKYTESFNNIASQYTDDQLKIIINCLPMSVKSVLESESSKYQEIMSVSGIESVKKLDSKSRAKDAEKKTGIKVDIIENKLNQTKVSGPIVIPSSVKTSKNKGPKPMTNRVEISIDKNLDKKMKDSKRIEKIPEIKIEKRTDNAAKLAAKREKSVSSDEVKKKKAVSLDDIVSSVPLEEDDSDNMEEKRGRGRPRKTPIDSIPKPKGKRGRPRKIEENEEEMEEEFVLPGMNDDFEEESETLPMQENFDDELDELPGLDDFDDEPVVENKQLEIDDTEDLEDVDDEVEYEDDFDDELEDVDDEVEVEDDFDDELEDVEDEVEVEDNFEDESEDVENEVEDDEEEYSEEVDLPELDELDDLDDLPNVDDDFDEDEMLPNVDDDFDEDGMLPDVDDDFDEDGMLPDVDEEFEENDSLPDASEEESEDDLLADFDDDTPSNAFSAPVAGKPKAMDEIETVKPRVDYSMSSLNSLLTKDKKIVTFIGTTKNGTSFLVNNLAALFSSAGINTAILDMTKNKNSYYIYTNNEEELRNTAFNSISKLQKGFAEGIKVNKTLSVYTALPNDGKDYSDAEPILSTLIQNHSLVLIDCDYDTDPSYFACCQEIYLVQSMDILTIQPLTAFLRDLKSQGVLESEKVRVVINKELKVKNLSEKVIIGGMSFYNDPSMSFMTELFNKDMVKFCSIPFDQDAYSKYLYAMAECNVSLSNYSKPFLSKLKILSDMVYPLSGKTGQSSNYGKISFNK